MTYWAAFAAKNQFAEMLISFLAPIDLINQMVKRFYLLQSRTGGTSFQQVETFFCKEKIAQTGLTI